MNQPLVSIITPSFQSACFITETIESIKRQDYPCIEHIIIDGNSDDGTLDILKKYPHLIWLSEPDNGQSHAFNKGLKMAKGEIIGWLNADDTYTPQAVSTAVRYLVEYQDAGAVYGDMQMINDKGILLWLRKSKAFDLATLFLENYFNQPTVFLRKAVFDHMGGLDENLHYTMDRELWLRVGSIFRMQYISDWIGANFRLHAGTKTHNNKPNFHAEWLSVVEHSIFDPLYKDIPLALKRRAIQQAQVRLSIALMQQEVKNRKFGMFLRELFSLMTHHWTYILKYPFRKLA